MFVCRRGVHCFIIVILWDKLENISAFLLLGNYRHGSWEKGSSVIKEVLQAQVAVIDFLVPVWNFPIQSYTSQNYSDQGIMVNSPSSCQIIKVASRLRSLFQLLILALNDYHKPDNKPFSPTADTCVSSALSWMVTITKWRLKFIFFLDSHAVTSCLLSSRLNLYWCRWYIYSFGWGF